MHGWQRPRLLAALVAAVATACGTLAPLPPTPSIDPSGSAANPGDVSFMVFGDPAELAAYEQLVGAFETKHPDIDVGLIHVPDQADYRQRLGADLAAGTPADVLLINYRRYAQFAATRTLEPLGPYLASSQMVTEDDFYREAIRPFQYRGGPLICVPQNLSSLVVYYNRDLFRAAGVPEPPDDWSWDDFLAAAKALTKDADGDGRTDQHGLGTEPSLFRVAPFIWQNGGELVEAEEHLRLALHRPAALHAITWFVELQTVHHVVPDAVEEESEDSESRFLNGRLAMYLNSRRGVPTYRTITSFDWDVAPLPRGKVAAGILHSDGYCMPSVVPDKGRVWTFIEFANSAEGQAIVARSGRTVPSLPQVAESDDFLDPDARPSRSRVFIDTLPLLRTVPIMPTWVDIEEAVGEELERAYYGDITVAEMARTSIERTARFLGEE